MVMLIYGHDDTPIGSDLFRRCLQGYALDLRSYIRVLYESAAECSGQAYGRANSHKAFVADELCEGIAVKVIDLSQEDDLLGALNQFSVDAKMLLHQVDADTRASIQGLFSYRFIEAGPGDVAEQDTMAAFESFARDCITYNTAFYKKPDAFIGFSGGVDPKDVLADSVCGDVHTLLQKFRARLPTLEQLYKQDGFDI